MAKDSVKKLELNFAECLHLKTLSPQKGSPIDLRAWKEIVKEIDLTSDELESIDVQQVQGAGVGWNKEKAESKTKKISLSKTQHGALKKKLEELADDEALPMQLLGVWEKVCE